MRKFWNKLFAKKNNWQQTNVIFELKAELSFRTVAQVAYKDDNGNNKIIRFFNDSWKKEVVSLSGKLEDIGFKIFVHTPNLLKQESVTLSVTKDGEVLQENNFKINKGKNFAGWFEL